MNFEKMKLLGYEMNHEDSFNPCINVLGKKVNIGGIIDLQSYFKSFHDKNTIKKIMKEPLIESYGEDVYQELEKFL